MKISAELKIDVKEGYLPVLTNELYKKECEIRNLHYLQKIDQYDSFVLELIYIDKGEFYNIIEQLKKYTEFKNIEITDTFDNIMQEGLIEIKGKIELKNIQDFQSNIINLSNLLNEKIADETDPQKYTSINKNIALVGSYKSDIDTQENQYYRLYSILERNSVVLKQFFNYSGFPLIIKYKEYDDFIKYLKSLEDSFFAIKIRELENEMDPESYNQIRDNIEKPLLFEFYDELTLYLLSVILRKVNSAPYRIKECNIGFIGINITVIRLARILRKMGCLRVLGFDSNEKQMMNFEKEGGMAITKENIYSNSDVLILLKNYFEDEDLVKLRTGIDIFSMLNNPVIENKIMIKKDCKSLSNMNWVNFGILSPFLFYGLIFKDNKFLNDSNIIKIAEFLAEKYSLKLPALFGSFYEEVNSFIDEL